ncbi:type III secretion system inner membrane ring subunit SctD [Aeromonas veronii]
METSFKLKLLNGTCMGQEVLLPLGLFTIGSGDSDLQLPLENGEQARLEVTSEGVILCSSIPCWVSGSPQKGGMLPIHSDIDLAGVHFVLAYANEEPPFLRIAERRSSHPLLISGVISTLLLSILVSSLLWPSKPIPATTAHDWLPAAMNFDLGLQANWLDDGTLVLSGRCKASRPLTALIEKLQATGVRLHQEAICDDDLLRSVQALLASYGYPSMTVVLNGKGEVLIDGDFRGDITELALALDMLPGLKGWQLSDHGAQELDNIIIELEVEGLLHGISARRTEHAWLLSGLLLPDQQAHLNTVIKRLNLGRNTHPLRFIGATSSVNELDYLPSPMAGIGGNASAPYLLLTNGMRLLPGSRVRQGMRVVTVSLDGISIAGHQHLIFLPLHH